MSTSRSTSFASRQTTTTSARGSPNYGTVLEPGQSAVYPSSIFTATFDSASGSSSSTAGLSKGAIAGIAIAAGVGALLLIAGVVLLVIWRRRRAARAKRESQTALLAGSGKSTDAGYSAKPYMRQSNGFNTFAVTPLPVAAGASTYAPNSAVPVAALRSIPSTQVTPEVGTGNSFAAGHRRYDSAASSAPLLHNPRDSTQSSPQMTSPSRSSGESDISTNHSTQRSLQP